ncbi:MAG: TonB-dependent receptor, partial [Gammaproteobacteria bacterium]|nr:TonB-dependent receptor [Gammaproteobacteria bacterium]
TIDFARGLSWELIGFRREVDNLIGSEDGMRVNTSNSVDFDGFEVTLKARLRDDLTISFDYVTTNAEEDGSSDQIADVPEDLLKANLTYRPSDLPVEFTTSVIRVGDLYDSVSGGIGRVEHGDYTVVDIGAAWYIDAARHHRVGARLENAFDEDYGSSLGRASRDSDDSSYAYTNLGTPRTWHVSYRFSF